MKEFHWQVNNKRYDNKIQALYDANGHIDQVKFYFMDNVLDRCNFAVEPTQSFNELCKTRCRQIRKKYDWVSLWFSGGWDSTEMVYSFVESGVVPDEIVIFDRTYMSDLEIPPAIQFAQGLIKQYWPRCQLTIVPIDHQWTTDFYKLSGENWFLEAGVTPRFSKNQRHFLVNNHPIFQQRRDRVKGTIGNIHATDKPKLHIYNNIWHAFQLDSVLQLLVGTDDFDLFYFSPELPELYVKQAYMAASWFEMLPGFNDNLLHAIQGHSMMEYYPDWNKAIGRRFSCDIESRAGSMKKITQEKGNNLETSILRKFASTDKEKEFSNWINGLTEIKKQFNLDLYNNIMPDITSKSYIMRPVQQVN